MHTALSFQRVHAPKRYNLAVYHAETNMAYAENPKGPLMKSMGKVFSPKDDPLGASSTNLNRMWLLPEEILYLLERGTIDVRWPAEDGAEDVSGLPMSLQGAYAAFIGMEAGLGGSLSYERYSVYSGLKRMGYIVHRAPSWNGPGPEPGHECLPPLPGTSWSLGLLKDRWRGFFAETLAQSRKRQRCGPLVTSSTYRSYGMLKAICCRNLLMLVQRTFIAHWH